jgi:hypothetical protein
MKIKKEDLINEEMIHLTIYREKASHFRGRLVDASIALEMKLAEVFTNFFNQDEIKRKFMYSSIFTNSELSFSSKSKILSELLSQFYPELLELFPDVLLDLNHIVHLRNTVDHSMVDSTQEFLKHRYSDRIQFIYFSGGQPQQLIMTDDDFNANMRRIAKVTLALEHLKINLNLN